jgi:endonuclease YncB( thermonuclease family)
MMRAVRAIALCAALAATNPCYAQMSPSSVPPPTSAPPTVYTPRETIQRTPMRVTVLDGRSFRDVGTGASYRLYGIETCEPGQVAVLGPQRWPCHVVPVAWLVAATLNKWVACNVVMEKNGARQARCASNEFPDMGLELLRIGAAVVDVAESGPLIDLYRNAEAEAKRSARGLWGSTFEMPWAYRQRQTSQPQPPPPR